MAVSRRQPEDLPVGSDVTAQTAADFDSDRSLKRRWQRPRDCPCFVRPAVTPLARAQPELLKLDSVPCLKVDASS
jgi:hypothetical protein